MSRVALLVLIGLLVATTFAGIATVTAAVVEDSVVLDSESGTGR